MAQQKLEVFVDVFWLQNTNQYTKKNHLRPSGVGKMKKLFCPWGFLAPGEGQDASRTFITRQTSKKSTVYQHARSNYKKHENFDVEIYMFSIASVA